MKNPLSVDNLLAKNLVAALEAAEYMLQLEQVEMLLLAFEKKIVDFSKEELLNIKFYLSLYRKMEPGADSFITKNYLKLIHLYLSNK